MSTPARRYFAERAIDPRLAHELGVTLSDDKRFLVFPGGRRRRLEGEGPKMLSAKGKPLACWWLQRATGWNTALVCEGESDALAALTALRSSPPQAFLQDLPVVCVPGTGFPVDRLVKELAGFKTAFLAFDGDDAGARYSMGVETALITAGVRPVPLVIHLDHDLASWMANISEAERGEVLANHLHDRELSAASLADLEREKKIAWHLAQAEELRAAA